MNQPTYECDFECGCTCNSQAEAKDSDWYWDEEIGCWICCGCAKIQ